MKKAYISKFLSPNTRVLGLGNSIGNIVAIKYSLKNNFVYDILVRYNSRNNRLYEQKLEDIGVLDSDLENKSFNGISLKNKNDIRHSNNCIEEIEYKYEIDTEVYLFVDGTPYKGKIQDIIFVEDEKGMKKILYMIKFLKKYNVNRTIELKNEDGFYTDKEKFIEKIIQNIDSEYTIP